MEKNNKLIAEFMGYEVKHGKCYSPKYNDGTIAPMQFDKSWDWLMPVIHKILQDNDGTEFFNFSANISHALFNNNINNAYKSVVEFINENGRELSYDEIISDLDKFDNQND